MALNTLQIGFVSLFLLMLAMLVWTWFLFPLTLQFLVWLQPKRPALGEITEWPFVTILITAHNEEGVIRARIENCLEQDYPKDRLEIIVASDHSTDQTEAVVNSLGELVRLVRGTTGRGKSLTQNDAVQQARGEIIVFSDADTRFTPGFLRKIVAPFADPSIGCVTGQVRWKNSSESTSTRSGASYWRFEHYLWKLENSLGLAFTASGQCLAFRRELFRPIDAYFGDDTVLPLDIRLQDMRVFFAREAVAEDEYFARLRSELRSRVRMSLRGFAGTLSRWKLLNPFRYPAQSAVIVSHKVMRWMTPFFLIALLASTLALSSIPLFLATLAAQLLFYCIAFIGFLLDRRSIHLPLVSAVYSFCVMNAAILVGVGKAMAGRRMYTYST